MTGRPWTKEDEHRLLTYASSAMTPAAAAELLGRSVGAMHVRLHRLGATWRQGNVSMWSVAMDAGCSPATATGHARRLFGRRLRPYGEGCGRRYRLTPEQAIELGRVLRRVLRGTAGHPITPREVNK